MDLMDILSFSVAKGLVLASWSFLKWGPPHDRPSYSHVWAYGKQPHCSSIFPLFGKWIHTLRKATQVGLQHSKRFEKARGFSPIFLRSVKPCWISQSAAADCGHSESETLKMGQSFIFIFCFQSTQLAQTLPSMGLQRLPSSEAGWFSGWYILNFWCYFGSYFHRSGSTIESWGTIRRSASGFGEPQFGFRSGEE